MALRIWRPYRYRDRVDPALLGEFKKIGARFESNLSGATDAIVTLLTVPIDRTVMERAPKLRVISNVAVGYDNIDVEEAGRRGILVTNTPDVLTEATADLAWALLLGAARRVTEAERYLRKGKWKRFEFDLLRGVDVHGKTLGIIGAGRIGQAVGDRATGFSMNVLYTSRNRKLLFEHNTRARRVDLRTLLRESDFVSVHVPLGAKTRGLIGAKELGRMKKTAVLVNAARGPVVDEAALVRALKSGEIRAAGLDVFEKEPKIHPGLLKLDNVVLLPHIGSSTEVTRLRMLETALRNCLEVLRGNVPPNLVNC